MNRRLPPLPVQKKMPNTTKNHWNDDLFNRKQYSEFLTTYLLSKDNFVLNLSAEWGAGKSFFIERWAKDLYKHHPVVTFNAWKHDFTQEPLLAILTEITKEFDLILASKGAEKSSKSHAKKCTKMFKSLLPILTKGAVKKVIGQQEGEALIQLATEDEEVAAETANSIVKQITDTFSSEIAAVDSFIKELEGLLASIKQESDQDEEKPTLPVFVFIDELDRCRPLFAIELLERIKHLFNVKDIHFVIATDTAQLAHSVNAIYGEKFNGGKYLRRFFNQEVTLPPPSNISFVQNLFKDFDPDALSLSSVLDTIDEWPSRVSTPEKIALYNCPAISEKKEFKEYVVCFFLLATSFNIDLRTQKQCMERIEAIFNALKTKVTDPYDGIATTLLIYLVLLDSSDYKPLKDILSDKGIELAPNISAIRDAGTRDSQYFRNTWQVTLLDTLTAYLQPLGYSGHYSYKENGTSNIKKYVADITRYPEYVKLASNIV